MTLKPARDLLSAAANAYLEDRAMTMGAAIAYYTVFSLAPVLILVIAVAGLAFGHEAAEGAIVDELGGLLGRDGARALQAMIRGAADRGSGIAATVVGLVTLAVAATSVFAELQGSLNVIWKAAPSPRSAVWDIVRVRLLSLSLIVALGFLLLVFLVVSAALTAFAGYLERVFPGLDVLMRLINMAVSFAVTAALFAMVYKMLPDTRIAWGDVWIGAAVTALLFTVGKLLIGLYIGSSNVASTYGAAGALVVILIWVYYSAQIFLFGAEFAKVYAERYGTRVRRGRRGAHDGDERAQEAGRDRA